MSGEELSAMILAGGNCSRMGSDKAALRMEGETILEHTVRVVTPLVTETIIVGSPRAGFSLPARFVTERIRGQGPLSGLITGLEAIANARAIVVGCDMPLLSALALVTLSEMDRGDGSVVVPVIGGRPQPLHAVWPRTALTPLTKALDAGTRSLQRALESLPVHWVAEDTMRHADPSLASFTSVNTPEEWEAVRASLRDRRNQGA